ncbi:MAG: hypothetical protein NTW47_05730 [Proteobacteria bacterium]|nr:hypothetical protein [Pseudomonadota bacterium]
MVCNGDLLERPAYAATVATQPVERVKRPFVYEIAVDVEQRRAVIALRDDVTVPDFVEQRACVLHGFPVD